MKILSPDVRALLLLGVPLIAALFIIQRRRLKIWRWLLAALCLVWFATTGYLLSPHVFLGGQDFLNQTPWKELILFLVMIIGMFSSVLNEAIKERKKKIADASTAGRSVKLKLLIDKWDLVQPLLFSLITFSVLYGQIGSSALTVANLALSFQNGFFWQAIINSRTVKSGV